MASTQGFSLTCWNTLHGMAIPPNSGATLQSAVSQMLKEVNSDVITLQEVDLNQDRSSGVNQVSHIAKLVGAKYWAFAPSLIGTPGEKWSAVESELIYTQDSVIPNQAMYGIGIVSKERVKSWHRINLGRSAIGMPLLIPGEKRAQFIYVSDEPRSALLAELENGLSISTTHLSFVPGKNVTQLRKIIKWLPIIAGKHILTGDFNLPWGLAAKISGWRDLATGATYPSWKPNIEFDYILSKDIDADRVKPLIHKHNGLSDHRALSITLT